MKNTIIDHQNINDQSMDDQKQTTSIIRKPTTTRDRHMLLFVYGSLMSPRVLASVLGHPHVHASASATAPGLGAELAGFRRMKIEGRSYPALVPAQAPAGTQTVLGILIQGLSEADIQTLDAFEGSDYQRTLVSVTVQGTRMNAYTYVWQGPPTVKLYGEWDFERDFLPREEETLKLWGFITL